MKKILLILLILIIALAPVSCGKEDVLYINHFRQGYFDPAQAGDNIIVYENKDGRNNYHLLNGNVDHVMSLCRDPLCLHDRSSGLCPDNQNLYWLDYKTDGEKLYIAAQDMLQLIDVQEMWQRHIYAVDLETMEMSHLLTFDTSESVWPKLWCDGEWLYYSQGFYKDSYVSSDISGTDDQYVQFFRIKPSGGKPEPIFDEGFPTFKANCFFVDDEYIYMINRGSESADSLDVYTKGGDFLKTEHIPHVGGISGITCAGGRTFILCTAPESVTHSLTENVEITLTDTVVYTYDDGALELFCDGVGHIMFSHDKAWCLTYDPVYYGTREMPTGLGSETMPMDFIDFYSPSFYALNLYSGEKIGEWTMDAGRATILGESAGRLIAQIGDMKAHFEKRGYIQGYASLILNSDGTITVQKLAE